MKAVYFTEFGSGFDNIELRDVPDPGDPGIDEVLVRVHGAGLNRADLLQARGLYPPPPGYSANIPGLEFAGEVLSTGGSVNRWRTGDRVFGITAGEAQAEYVLIDQRLLMRVPDGSALVTAAAVPEAFITAHDAVITQAGLSEGETLLIHAVGSGVGLAGLQIAKAVGAKVIGTSRTAEKLTRCIELGLDLGIASESVEGLAEKVLKATQGKGVDVILDLVGAAYFSENLTSLAQKGRLMLVGLSSGPIAEFDLSAALRKRATIIGTVLRGRSIEEKAEATARFADQFLASLDAQTIRPIVDRVFPASGAAEAYEYLASNKSFGKVVLDFSS